MADGLEGDLRMASPASPTMTSDIHKPLRDDVRLLGELLGNTLKAREGEDAVPDRGTRARAGQERPRRRTRGFRAPGGRARRHDRRRGASGRARVRAIPESRQHRRAASPDAAAPGVSKRARSPAAGRLVRRDVRPPDESWRVSRGALRHGAAPAHRAGAHRASDRDRPPHAAAEIRSHRAGAGVEGSCRSHRARTRRRHRDASPRDCRLRGRPTKSAARGRRRWTKCAAACWSSNSRSGTRCRAISASSIAPCTRTPAAACRSTSRRSASAAGWAAIATAIRTSHRK